jgi:twitching motility protein PilU
MINSPLIADRIREGRVDEMKEDIERSSDEGMCTFEQSLFELYENGAVSREEALRYADSVNDLRLRIERTGKRFQREHADATEPEWSIARED